MCVRVCVCVSIYMLSLAEPLKMWSGTHLEDVCVSVRGGWLKRLKKAIQTFL